MERHPVIDPDVEEPASVVPSPDSPAAKPYTGLAELFTGPINIRSIALTGLFIYTSLFVLYIAKAIMLPIIVAMILNLLLAPLMRVLRKFHLPAPLAAGGILLAFIGFLTLGIFQLSTPASVWLERAPQALEKVELKFDTIKQSVFEMGKATQALEHVASLPQRQPVKEIAVQKDSLGGLLLGWTTEFLYGLFSTLILLYFFLASGNLFLEKLVKVLPSFANKRRAVEIVRGIEENISRHLVMVTCINTVLGLAVGLVMYLLGMPNPMLWGVMAGVLNFIPYVGSLVGLCAITLAAAFTFEQWDMMAMVSGSYLFLTALEGNFITPHLLGNKLTLNPVVILISVLFWGWLWGTLGALLAVPLAASFKIICDQIEPLHPIGEFLGP